MGASGGTTGTIGVIGAGLPRTGTLSLRAALQRLGFGPCYHMVELLRHLEHAPLWLAAVEGGPVAWPRVLDGYRAAVDWPASFFYRELAAAFPDAVVVLTLREPGEWYRSVRHMLHGSGSFRVITSATAERLVPPLVPLNRAMAEISRRTFGLDRDRVVAGELDEATAVAGYHRHVAAVRAAVPAERLLEFRVAEGWDPLCAFLGVPVPAAPFPHRNEGASVHRRMRWRNAATYARGLGLTASGWLARAGRAVRRDG